MSDLNLGDKEEPRQRQITEDQGTDSGNAQTAAPAAAAKYFLVGNNSRPGAVGYDIDVYVNGTLFRTIKNNDGQAVVDHPSRSDPG